MKRWISVSSGVVAFVALVTSGIAVIEHRRTTDKQVIIAKVSGSPITQSDVATFLAIQELVMNQTVQVQKAEQSLAFFRQLEEWAHTKHVNVPTSEIRQEQSYVTNTLKQEYGTKASAVLQKHSISSKDLKEYEQEVALENYFMSNSAKYMLTDKNLQAYYKAHVYNAPGTAFDIYNKHFQSAAAARSFVISHQGTENLSALGGDWKHLGTVSESSRNTFPQPFKPYATSAQSKHLYGPVQYNSETVVYYVAKVLHAGRLPFKDVKNQIAHDIQQDQSQTELSTAIGQLDIQFPVEWTNRSNPSN